MTQITYSNLIDLLEHTKLLDGEVDDVKLRYIYKVLKDVPLVITTDTRKIETILNKNFYSLFIALPSTRFSPEDLAEIALDLPTKPAVITTKLDEYRFILDVLEDYLIPVTDTTKALEVIAAYARRVYNPLTIAITGSSGKTTLKEIISQVLRKHYKKGVIATKGNFNNQLGVPITLNDLTISHAKDGIPPHIAVVEHGANHANEINYTTRISQPHIAIINNVQPAHTEGFGGIEGVALAKSEIFNHLADNGIKIINIDSFTNDLFFARKGKQTLLTVSKENDAADFFIEPHSIRSDRDGLSFVVQINGFEIPRLSTARADKYAPSEIFIDKQRVKIRSNLRGEHNAYNLTIALAACLAAGMTMPHIIKAMEDIKELPGRGNLLKTIPFDIIDDTYNANPGSVIASMNNLATLTYKDKIYVLGALAEIDEESKVEFYQKVYKEFVVPQKFLLFGYVQFTNTLSDAIKNNPQEYKYYSFTYQEQTVYAVEYLAAKDPHKLTELFYMQCQTYNIKLYPRPIHSLGMVFKGSRSSRLEIVICKVIEKFISEFEIDISDFISQLSKNVGGKASYASIIKDTPSYDPELYAVFEVVDYLHDNYNYNFSFV
ncbi:UDP-N-acetylmuramoyl-tripeptide--D-alanyl-D-alanine ligase [Psittacicella hinzii]|uniref:Mur ligase central domain-containing protein n=1 Tax=Psittacicella hinzii TaxID=2028575 RepID=A0A3A1YQL5_9GAMM|nr:UDP-N-acetylmuramoyl-tripeptide--D-alanyl-D-alanine ligase [Psittacicella hinzii]RIY38664.1 hypothetical protein CKF58_03660 [Psittacicella hinzii]